MPKGYSKSNISKELLQSAHSDRKSPFITDLLLMRLNTRVKGGARVELAQVEDPTMAQVSCAAPIRQ